ncbi:MAG: hypothetical protein ACE5IC_09695 [Candidatus Brocadiales bacterium]
MSLLDDIQAAAIDANSDLGTLLRKCKVLAARLGSVPLENWLLWESNGYPPDVEVPDYRIWPLEPKGHFAGPFGSSLQNASIPLVCIPEKARKHYERYKCRESIASIEALLRKSDKGTVSVSTGDLAVLLGTNVYQGLNCIQAWAEFSTTHLVELLNTVRNRILDFALAIHKEAPTAGESVGNVAAVIQPEKVTQIFNTTVYGGSANLVGTAYGSSIVFNIVTNDFASLARALRHEGISDSDIKELHGAVESDHKPIDGGKFGPKVSSWVGKMMQKAADGSWGIGIGAAGNLLARAIAKYYGL